MQDEETSYKEEIKGVSSSKAKKFLLAPSEVISFLLTFFLMFGLWIILSGVFEPLLLGLGVISSLVVAIISRDLIFAGFKFRFLGIFFRFTGYIPWLLYQIFKANLHLLILVFDPKMEEKIYPHIIEFETRLNRDLSIVTMANSITLTPGTITVSADMDGKFKVHAIDLPSAEGLPGEMEEKVLKVYGEDL